MRMRWRGTDQVFVYGLAVAFIIGLWLRIYLISQQVLIDDEWHGLYYSINKSAGWLLTHFSIPGATCIPLNFYSWAVDKTVGWSETVLRLPSLICGALLVMAGPLLARPLIGRQQALWLALLLAISPVLIFYSRICRPYSAVALLTFCALLVGARWMKTGSTRLAVVYVTLGSAAIYFHLFAAIAVAMPGLVTIGRRARKVEPAPTLRQWLLVMGALVVISAALVLPPLIDSLHSTFYTVARAGRFDPRALPRIPMLISGSGQPVLCFLFWTGLVTGAVAQIRQNGWFALLLLGLYPLHALALLVSRPDAAQSAIVLTRYCIALLPVSLLLVSCGIQTGLEAIASRAPLKPALRVSIALAFIAALGMTGPLPQCYVPPNAFTSHGAYQHRYGPIDWNSSFHSDLTPASFTLRTVIRAEEISPFYRHLAEHPGSRPIVEYPMMIGDHFNPLYYYQHFHRRRVIVGYTTDVSVAKGLAPGNIYGSTYVDQVLSLIRNPGRLRLHNMVSMDDLASMRARNAEYIIIHKNYEAQLRYVAQRPPSMERLLVKYVETLGPPAFDDDLIAVFRL